MKKIVLLSVLLILFAVLPVTAQSDELAGTWVGFLGPDFTFMRFSQNGGNLAVIDTLNESYTEYSGTYQADGHTIIFTHADGEQEEMTYSVSHGQLILDWYGERVYTRIDDSYFPEDPEASPYIGENRQYRVEMAEDGGIRIFEAFNVGETLEIPSSIFGIPVTEIGDDSICYKEELKHLILPDGIRRIGVRAFEENALLEDVRLPDTLESIGGSAFSYCYNLKEIIIPEGVKLIEDCAFWQCSFLRRIVLPESLEETYEDSFYGIYRPTFFVKAGSYAEQFCRENEFRYTVLDEGIWEQIHRDGAIPSEVLPETTDPALVGAWVTLRIDDLCFFRFSAGGDELTVINSSGYYPDTYRGAWEVEDDKILYDWQGYGEGEPIPYHFEDDKLYLAWDWFGEELECTRIDESDFPDDFENSPYLGENKEYWFERSEDGTLQINGYSGSAETVVIPDNIYGYPVTSIRGTAFMSTEGMKHVVIPEGVTAIYAQSFAENRELETVQLPDTLEMIGYSAFEYCTGLKELVIPEGVNFIGTDAFWGCENLTSLVFPASLEEIEEGGIFDNDTRDSVLITVTEGSYAEQYCRENELNCVTADGVKVSGGASADDEIFDVPVDGPTEEEPYEETNDDVPADEPYEEVYAEPVYGDKELYDKAMALYKEEKYFSARQAFLMSGYDDCEEWAEKCIQAWPATGEVWHDRSQWLQDMELTIVVNQPEDAGMLIRIYKDKAPVSYLFLAGSDSVTVRLPGNGYYEIRDGVGYNWYGIKEAFGSDGVYEAMTFDENGTEKVFLQSYYAYTLSINISITERKGDDVYTESLDYSKFVEE